MWALSPFYWLFSAAPVETWPTAYNRYRSSFFVWVGHETTYANFWNISLFHYIMSYSVSLNWEKIIVMPVGVVFASILLTLFCRASQNMAYNRYRSRFFVWVGHETVAPLWDSYSASLFVRFVVLAVDQCDITLPWTNQQTRETSRKKENVRSVHSLCV